MSTKIFLYKDNREDRDCIKYINSEPLHFECDHYFSGVHLEGACFSSGFQSEETDYKNIITILTEKELKQLIEFDKNIHNLGYSIKKGDERYKQGVSLCNKIQPIYDKLLSKENIKLFEKIKQEEADYLKDEYSLSDNDINYIFNNYSQDYRDRAVIGTVFNDINEAAEEEAESLGYTNKDNERYFNYETFGEDLLEGEQYLELENGRIVYLMY